MTDIRHNLQVNVDNSRLTLTRPFYLQSCLKMHIICCPVLISATECSVKTNNFKTSFCSGKRISGERAKFLIYENIFHSNSRFTRLISSIERSLVF